MVQIPKMIVWANGEQNLFPFLYEKFIFGNCVLRNLKKLECSVLPGKIAYEKNDPTGKLYLDCKNYKYLIGSHIFKLL